jgi:hypothetical protein
MRLRDPGRNAREIFLPGINGLLCAQWKANTQENAKRHPCTKGVHPAKATANVFDDRGRAALDASFF